MCIPLKILIALLMVLLMVHTNSAYNILGVFPTMVRSHYITGGSLMRGLAAAGHNVTVISPFPSKNPIPNFRDYAIQGVVEEFEKLNRNYLDATELSYHDYFKVIHRMGLFITNFTMQHPRMTAFLNDPNEHFDLIIVEVFINEALLGLGQHFNAPVIGFSTLGSTIWTNDLVGSPSPSSYVPHNFLSFTDKMNFVERVGNVVMNGYERFVYYRYLPLQEQIYQETFPGSNKPSLDAIRKDISLVLLNQHFTISTTKPYVPNMIEIGGIHINRGKPNPLPEDIKTFIEGAKHGVIYFSLGSNIKCTLLPIAIRDGLLRAFGRQKERVLWKWEDPTLPGKPNNVMINSWFPQDDIIAHPNVKLFITHGGLLSLMESVYHGLPVIGIPVFADQALNMARAEAYGYGLMISYKNLSEISMSWALDEVLRQEKYFIKAKEISERFRDQPMPPMELARYWVEYVVRHRGAPHLHSAGQDLMFIEYHNLDVFAFLAVIIGTLVYLIVFLFETFFRLILPKQQNTVNSNKRKKNN